MVDSQPLLVAIVGRIETEKMVEMIAAGLTAAGTILLAVVAVFQDAIRRWLTRPKLELQLSPCAPDFHRTTIRHFYTVWNPQTGMPGYQQSMEIPCYYFRLRIINKGNCEAREVEVLCEGEIAGLDVSVSVEVWPREKLDLESSSLIGSFSRTST